MPMLHRDRLGDNAVMWSVQSRQPLFALVVSTDAWITRHPDRQEVPKVPGRCRGVHRHSPGRIPDDRAASSTLIQRAYMPTGMAAEPVFALTLDQSLILAMEDEARWMITNNLTNATAVTGFPEVYLHRRIGKRRDPDR